MVSVVCSTPLLAGCIVNVFPSDPNAPATLPVATAPGGSPAGLGIDAAAGVPAPTAPPASSESPAAAPAAFAPADAPAVSPPGAAPAPAPAPAPPEVPATTPPPAPPPPKPPPIDPNTVPAQGPRGTVSEVPCPRWVLVLDLPAPSDVTYFYILDAHFDLEHWEVGDVVELREGESILRNISRGEFLDAFAVGPPTAQGALASVTPGGDHVILDDQSLFALDLDDLETAQQWQPGDLIVVIGDSSPGLTVTLLNKPRCTDVRAQLKD